MSQGASIDSAAYRLRRTTRSFHDMVDATYNRFDLGKRSDYAQFLLAHARATCAAEAHLSSDPTLPAWRPRAPLLVDDLAALGLAPPAPLAFDPPKTDGANWGILYVLEGSRLGGTVLLKGAPSGAPCAFLSARHLSGEWRTLLQALDTGSRDEGFAWGQAAALGAAACFELYERAVAA